MFHKKTDFPWRVEMHFWIRTSKLQSMMQKGLRWTTNNILHTRSQIEPERPGPYLKHSRRWYVTERPDSPDTFHAWEGQIIVFAASAKELASFRLSELKRHQIDAAKIHNHLGNEVFVFERRNPDCNTNCIDESDPFDLWWLWPMESLEPGSWISWCNGSLQDLIKHLTLRRFWAKEFLEPGSWISRRHLVFKGLINLVIAYALYATYTGVPSTDDPMVGRTWGEFGWIVLRYLAFVVTSIYLVWDMTTTQGAVISRSDLGRDSNNPGVQMKGPNHLPLCSRCLASAQAQKPWYVSRWSQDIDPHVIGIVSIFFMFFAVLTVMVLLPKSC